MKVQVLNDAELSINSGRKSCHKDTFIRRSAYLNFVPVSLNYALLLYVYDLKYLAFTIPNVFRTVLNVKKRAYTILKM